MSINKLLLKEGRYDKIVNEVTRVIIDKLKEGASKFQFKFKPIKDTELQTEIIVYWNDDGDIGVAGWIDLNINKLTLEIWMDSRYMKVNIDFLIGEIKNSVMHEIQHLAQHKFKERESGGLYDQDRGFEGLEYYDSPFEIDAWVRGLYKQAKHFKKPLIDVFKLQMEYLDLEEKDKPILLKKWIDYAKKNLPKAILNIPK
jgi:hypothetical protein